MALPANASKSITSGMKANWLLVGVLLLVLAAIFEWPWCSVPVWLVVGIRACGWLEDKPDDFDPDKVTVIVAIPVLVPGVACFYPGAFHALFNAIFEPSIKHWKACAFNPGLLALGMSALALNRLLWRHRWEDEHAKRESENADWQARWRKREDGAKSGC
jgi:hypothetical protein